MSTDYRALCAELLPLASSCLCAEEMVDSAVKSIDRARAALAQPEPVPVAERLPELRGMFERILCVARSSGGPLVGNIQLADRLLDAVVGWAGDALPVPGAEGCETGTHPV
jgi:hypothetical protein